MMAGLLNKAHDTGHGMLTLEQFRQRHGLSKLAVYRQVGEGKLRVFTADGGIDLVTPQQEADWLARSK